jgi:hypothetical protein
MEALTASGHLSLIEISGSLEEINQQVLSRLLNGYDPALPEPERTRRFQEICNELVIQRTHKAIVAGHQDPETAVLELSDFITGLTDREALELGYRPYNRKGMVRSTHLRKDSEKHYTRVIEQISRSNGLADTSFALLHSGGIYPQGYERPDVLALKNPVLYSTRDLVDGAIDIQRKLDSFAGAGVQYGEIGNEQHVPYYELREESARREAQIEYFIDRLADYDKRLEQLEARGAITGDQRHDQYAQEIRQILRAICTLAPEYAEDCFGTAAAPHYRQAAMHEAAGDHEAALRSIEAARPYEQPILFCGVMISPEEAARLGIKVDGVGQLISEGKESWRWKKGVCQVKVCRTRPGKTEVGPCSVCRRCQAVFDNGGDPAKDAKPEKVADLDSRRQKIKPLGELAIVA